MSRKLSRHALACAGAAVLGVVVFAAVGAAARLDDTQLSNVGPNLKANGYAPGPKLSKQLQQVIWAYGGTRLENPSGIVTDYGYENDVPSTDDPTRPQMVPTAAAPGTEAQKTEPDKNTYLAFNRRQHGPDASYNYGKRFVFQGHEAGATVPGTTARQGLLTRVNLDADAQHRVTLMATKDTTGAPIATIDGSTWDPFAQRLILTTENTNAPTYAATADFPSEVEDVSGALGRGGYEGVQNDSDGNLWIVEDIGGSNKPGTVARIPNSFVYRYVPARKGDLHNGKLQVLQVMNEAGTPITQASQTALNAPDQVLIHSYGHSLNTRWVTIHDTAVSNTPFNANTLAKAANATPFKRPENGLFRPGSDFKQFFFDETGDTNATSAENGDKVTGAGGAGGWGAIQKLTQSSPSANSGKLTLFFRCNENVTGLDNNAFLSASKITFVEDAGDTLHSQRSNDTRAGVAGVNAGLDSGWVFDVNTNYANPNNQPVRWLAEGRDPAAALDGSATPSGFGKNDGDNEITGVHISNGDPTRDGILGAEVPKLFKDGWRWFWTQQHGENYLYEVIPASAVSPVDDDD